MSSNGIKIWEDIWQHASLLNLCDKKMGRTAIFGLEYLNTLITTFERIKGRLSVDTQCIAAADLVRNLNILFSNQLRSPWELTRGRVQASYSPERLLADVKSVRVIHNLLTIGGNCMSLCGGAVLNLLDKRTPEYSIRNHGSDFDFFFHCGEEDADRVLSQCMEYLSTMTNVKYKRNQRVIICHVNNIKIQFIMRLYLTKDRILLGFDMPGCQHGYNIVDGYFTSLQGALSLVTGCYPADMTQRCASYSARIHKYSNKWFCILLPGLDDDHNSFENKKMRFELVPGGIYFTKPLDDRDFSDYSSASSEVAQLVQYPPAFEFQSRSAKAIMRLGDRTVSNTLSVSSHWERPPCPKFCSSTEVFVGSELLQSFAMAQVVTKDERLANNIWNTRQSFWFGEAKKLALNINTELKWKQDDLRSTDFGKFSPVLADHNEWYGGRYKSVIIGISHDRFQAWMDCKKNVDYIASLPQEIFKLLSTYWFDAEVSDASNKLSITLSS
jgi:hypothetical protein